MSPELFKSPKEVLVIEDSQTDTKMILIALGKTIRKKNVVTKLDGEAAMAWLRDPSHPKPDLIFLDLNLPRKDGWEILAECKADPELRAIPIVVFTTSQLSSEVRRCYELGANSFVGKPFEIDNFVQAIQKIENYWLETSAPAN